MKSNVSPTYLFNWIKTRRVCVWCPLLFLLTSFFKLAGLALIVVGVIYQLDLNDYTNAVPEDYQSIGLASTLTIAIGCIIFLIAFFGCCGAVRESPCLLTTVRSSEIYYNYLTIEIFFVLVCCNFVSNFLVSSRTWRICFLGSKRWKNL